MKRDLSVTALYTSQAWVEGGLSHAEWLASKDGAQVYGATNAALGLRRLFRRGLPSLPHSLVQRHVMIDRLLADFAPGRVLELAAGLSRRGVATTADPGIDYVEVDGPAVLARKRELLARHTDAQRALAARPNLRLVPGRVETTDLARLGGTERPLLVIAEGLLMYLDADAQRDLWRRVAAALARAPRGRLVFDLVPPCEEPAPGLFGKLLGRGMRAFTGGASFAPDERTRDDIVRELRDAGFASVELFEPRAAGAAWDLPHLDRPTQQLVFAATVAPGAER